MADIEKATLRPWVTDDPNRELIARLRLDTTLGHAVYDYIADCDAEVVDKERDECIANAALIVAAVNAYDPARAAQVEAQAKVCHEIREIVAEYHRQEGEHIYGTPGGLEHMGDVWRLLKRWDAALAPFTGGE